MTHSTAAPAPVAVALAVILVGLASVAATREARADVASRRHAAHAVHSFGPGHGSSAHGSRRIDVRRAVVPPQSTVAGRAIGEWIGDHVAWTLSFLAGENPVYDDPTGTLAHLGDVGGPVFFVGAAGNVHRRFDVPCGQHLLVPIANQVWLLEGDDTEDTARAANAEFIASVTSLVARLDGRRIPDLYTHIESTPVPFAVTIPDGGLLGDVGGTFQAVSDGYWLMIRPLPKGPHTLTVGTTAAGGEFEYRARFDIRVTGRCPRR